MNFPSVNVTLHHISPKRYSICCKSEFPYLNYVLFEEVAVKINVQTDGTILSKNYEDDIKKAIEELYSLVKEGKKYLCIIDGISALPYIKSILPCSHWATNNNAFHTLKFKIEFVDNIHSKYIKEIIGIKTLSVNQLSNTYIQELYNECRKEKLKELENEIIESVLKNSSSYKNLIHELQTGCTNTSYMRIKISNDRRKIFLLSGQVCIYEYEYYDDLFGEFEKEVKEKFIVQINKQIQQGNKIRTYVKAINGCSNNIWACSDYDGDHITVYLYDPILKNEICCKNIWLCNSVDLKGDIANGMNSLLEWAENYKGIRFLEDVNR